MPTQPTPQTPNVIQSPIVIVGGLPINVLSRKEWAEQMIGYCKAPTATAPILHFSVNGQVIANCATDPHIKSLHDQADALDADGQPMVMASRLLTSTPLPERVATTDFFHDAAAAAQKAGVSFYFLGSTPKNIEIAVQAIRAQYPNLKISGYRDGYVRPEDEPKVIQDILAAGTDILWIGMGVPKQLEFAIRNRTALTGVKWIKTCGGLFDYFTPEVKRAPQWMQSSGLEWLYRTIQEPKKFFWRYLTTNGIALYLLLTRTRTARINGE